MRASNATAVAFLILLGACTHRAYEGPELPPTVRATVEGVSRFRVVASEEVEILAVDGKPKPAFAASVEVLPGLHTITVRHHAQFAFFRTSRDCVIEFEALAGHDYAVDCKSRGSTLSAWLTDKATGDTIADCSTVAPTPRPTPSSTPIARTR